MKDLLQNWDKVTRNYCDQDALVQVVKRFRLEKSFPGFNSHLGELFTMFKFPAKK